MKVYDETKTRILKEYDLEKGYLKQDTITHHFEEVKEIKEQGHYETIREYPNGGKDVEWVVEVEGVEYQPAREEIEDIVIYVSYTDEELHNIKLDKLRAKREQECFSIINRGQFWYDKLDVYQKLELNEWYQGWLDVTETLVEPTKPEWLK